MDKMEEARVRITERKIESNQFKVVYVEVFEQIFTNIFSNR